MIDKIKEASKLMTELDQEYSIIAVANNYVQVYEIEKFISIANGKESISVKEKMDSDFPYEATFKKDNITFLIVLTESEYDFLTDPSKNEQPTQIKNPLV